MADEKTPITDKGAAAGDKGAPKKIAGKYDSPEHAIESIDKAMTTNFHSMEEKFSAIQQLLERALTPIGEAGVDRGSDYNRGRTADAGPNPDDDINTADFLSSPGKILSTREKKIREESRREAAAIASNVVTNATTVLRFQMKNPDLDEHEALVGMFMRETNDRDPLSKRLADAAKKTRAYLKNMKGEKEDEGDLGTDEHVESPTGKKIDEGKGSEENVNEDDDSLAAEIKFRKDQRTARFKNKQTG